MNENLNLDTTLPIYGEEKSIKNEKDLSALRKKVIQEKGDEQCLFCKFESTNNMIYNINGVEKDLRSQNLSIVDKICLAWKKLGDLKDNEAYISYLPGLNAEDVNHLQRTIFIALNSSDKGLKEDAEKLLTWLVSHRQYVEDAWKTYEPVVFSDAFRKIQNRNEEVFSDLSLILNPNFLKKEVKEWKNTKYKQNEAEWKLIHHTYTFSA